MSRVCTIIGIGPGNGASIARTFASQNYRVALLSRNQEYIDELASSIKDSRAYQYDTTKPDAAKQVFAQIEKDLGPTNVLVYNAGAGAFKSIEDATLEQMEMAWRVNVAGLFSAVKQVMGGMCERGEGNIIITGATASLRGGKNFAPFASAKAGQRNLAQSMAKFLGPKGVHVSYVIVDGVIDLERTRKLMTNASDEDFIKPDDLAKTVHFLTEQPKSAWTFEVDLRPYREKW